MFKITPIQDKSRQKEICEILSVTYRENAFAYLMFDVESGDIMGMSQFEILGESGMIYDIKEREGLSDDEAMFILGRQTMNFIDLCGAHLCYAEKSGADARLLHAIGFREERDGALFADMNGMFDGKCDH